MYFTITGNLLVAKNKLHKEIQDEIEHYDRVLIEDKDIHVFKTEILDKVDVLNKLNPRCKPVEPKFYSNNGIDYHLHFSEGIIQLHIYQSESTYSKPTRTQI